MQSNETTISEANNQSYYCGGVVTSPAWGTLDTVTLSLAINTSSCRFNSIPLYFTSMDGVGNQFGLASSTAIYGPSNISFTIYINSLFSWSAAQMLSLSNTEDWTVNWLGITY